MKTEKEINEIIKQGLEEYAKAETKSEDTADVTFSKEHEEKMQKMFVNMRKENKSNKPADRELVIHIKFNWLTKVAVAVIVVGVFISAVSTGIKAWRECKLNSYEGSGDYSWLLPNDTSEVYETKTDEDAVEYVRGIFPDLSGDISDVKIEEYSKTQRICFKNNDKKINVKLSKTVNWGLDIKPELAKKVYIEETEILCYFEEELASYIWEKEGIYINLLGKIDEQTFNLFFTNINYEKIETNF